MEAQINLLIVDDDLAVVKSLERQLRHRFNVLKALNASEGLRIVEQESVQVILSDERMPGMTGVEFLEMCKRKREDAIRIIISGFADTSVLKKAINDSQVHGFIGKPVNFDELYALIEKHLPSTPAFFGIVGKSQRVQDVFKLITKSSRTDSTILITGESGTGKELVAKAIHATSPRRDKPFVVENCAAITQSILEAELFGHVKGAFTGAMIDKQGLFELADKGILMLDEIGDLNKDMQTKLLRVIENGTFRKVGGTKTIKVDVQLICATNRDLYAEVAKGNFREDLFYRINVINIHLPPLRYRKEDIPVLAGHFARIYGKKLVKDIKLDPEVLTAFSEYHWPGNIRELEHEIERSVAITDTDTISLKHLTINKQRQSFGPIPLGAAMGFPAPAPMSYSSPAGSGMEEAVVPDTPEYDFYGLVEDYEQRLIRNALRMSNGSKRRAAVILKMTRQSLCNKINKYGIEAASGEAEEE